LFKDIYDIVKDLISGYKISNHNKIKDEIKKYFDENTGVTVSMDKIMEYLSLKNENVLPILEDLEMEGYFTDYSKGIDGCPRYSIIKKS